MLIIRDITKEVDCAHDKDGQQEKRYCTALPVWLMIDVPEVPALPRSAAGHGLRRVVLGMKLLACRA